MATIKFLLQSKKVNSSIYVRLSNGRNNVFTKKTGLHVDFKKWSKSNGLPIGKDPETKNLKTKLRKLKEFIYDKLNDSISKNEIISASWLESVILWFLSGKQKGEKELTLVEYGREMVKKLRFKKVKNKTLGVSSATTKKYTTIVNKLEAFQEYQKKVFYVKDVNLSFRDSLIYYFQEVDNLGENSIGRYLKFVKSICIDAEKHGIETSPQIKHFFGFTIEVPKITLSFSELDKIENTRFVDPSLTHAKDWLIIGCYTGQRVSDLMRMNESFIQNIQSFKFIVLTQVKGGKLVQIPIHEKVKKVLSKYKGGFPPVFTKNKDSNATTFNKLLKKVCKNAGINENVEGSLFNKELKRSVKGVYPKYKLVSSHTCRRSFATNFYGNPKYPTPLLMNITGHSTEKVFLSYIGKKPIDYSLQLAEIWSKEALKGNNNKPLQVLKNTVNGI